jgi:DNA-binding CsgD family transcriptional regulator/PAS domain-containing protein
MGRTTTPTDVVDLLYTAALQTQLWPQALHELAHALGAIGTVVLPISTRGPRGTLVSPEMRESEADYHRRWWCHDTRVARVEARHLSRGVFSEADLFSAEELKRDPFRQEFLRSYGMGDFAAQIVSPLPKLVVSISVQRALSGGPFEPSELQLLASLGRHAARAVTISLRLTAARADEKTLLGALARLECGAVVIDDRGRVVFMNAAAECAMGDGLSTAKCELRAASPQHQPLLDRLIAAVCGGTDGPALGPIALPRPSGKLPLLLQAIPLRPLDRSDEIDRLLFALPTALIMIVDPEQEHEHSPIEALRLLGLTQAEARIAALVGAGHSRREAAEALAISEWTAREALKRVFSKLAISRQSELVKLVHRLAVLAQAPRTARPVPPKGGSFTL